MIASAIVMGRALAPIEVALANWKQFVAAREGISRLRTILKVTEAPAAPKVILQRPQRILTVEDLSVVVPGTQNTVISNLSFGLGAGTGLALLGASAAGKSSLAKALVGIWPAATGAVRLDGAPIDRWGSDDLGRYIGYLPQDVALFDGTVATNIARFDASATSDAILEAARVSGAHEMILGLPDGYDTRIGERGTSLSAGQRQRIGLARAVFGRPFLIVLDEPNANLDGAGENALVNAIETLRSEQSIVIVISHRPNALAALDMTMVISDGRSIAFGPREEVFARVAPPTVRAGGAPKQGSHFARGCGCHAMTDSRSRAGGHTPGHRRADNVVELPQEVALIRDLRRLQKSLDQECRERERIPRAVDLQRTSRLSNHSRRQRRKQARSTVFSISSV